jgi:hypothetical protein
VNEDLIQVHAAPGEALWDRAPAWRHLVVAASALTLAALALPALLPAQAPPSAPALEAVSVSPSITLSLLPPPRVAAARVPAPVCRMTMPDAPLNHSRGVVIGFEDHATSLARIPRSEASAGGRIDPAYIDNLRVRVRFDSGQVVVLILPKTLTVRAGDRVTAQSGYRNAALPCNYIPNLITADLGPVPPPDPAGAHEVQTYQSADAPSP